MQVMGNIASPEVEIREAVQAIAADDVVVAYSGGCDSTVLLHALSEYRPQLRVRALHVDHGLQASSAEFADHCLSQCANLAVACQILRPAQPAPSSNIEAWARQQRYLLMREQLAEGEVLLTAHHQQDQAETLLLNLLRGSGIDGLAAMPEQRELSGRSLLRPFLHLKPQQLKAWARARHLAWIEDASNQNPSFDRNFLRLQVLPLLEERFAGATTNLARSSHLLARFRQQTPELSETSLSVDELRQMSEEQRCQQLRSWLRAQHYPMPRYRMWPQIWQQMLASASDRSPLVSWPGVELRRYRGRIYAMAPSSQPIVIDWQDLPATGLREWPYGGQLQWSFGEAEHLRISNVQGGERLLMNRCHHSLKKLFQQLGIPPWQRHQWPVIWQGEQCLAIGNRWHADGVAADHFQWRLD